MAFNPIRSSLAMLAPMLLTSIAANPALAQEGFCQKGVTLQKIQRLSGQGIGEGKLEITAEASIPSRNISVSTAQFKLGKNDTVYPDLSVGTLEVPLDGSGYSQTLMTKITEHEVGADKFVGGTDHGDATSTIDIQCGTTEEVAQEIKIHGRKTGKVSVHYVIGPLEREYGEANQGLTSAEHTIVIDGSVASGSTAYTVVSTDQLTQVSGSLAGHNVTIQGNDNVSGNRAEGHVGAGKDGLTATGDMPRIQLENPDNARVLVNGKPYHTIVIDGSAGSGSTQYSIRGGGQLTQVEGEIAGYNATIQGNDNVSGNAAQGNVAGGVDAFIVSGEMPEIDLQDPQSAQVVVDGQLYVAMEVMPETQVMPETEVLSQ